MSLSLLGIGSSAGKESACDGGDPGSISELGKSPGEGIGYPLQSSWASLVAQIVKNLPAVRDRFLGCEDPLEEDMANPLQYSCPENPLGEEPGGLQSMGSQRVGRD